MVRIKRHKGLDYLEVSNKIAQAKISLQGAHIFHFQVKREQPLLWLSESSFFKKNKAVRGGIPICWPWFGPHKEDPKLPNHGFARTSLWEHLKTQELSDTETKVTLRLSSSKESLKLWPYRFELILEMHIGAQLQVSLTTKNIDNKAFAITNALHTYLSIADINTVFIDGLDKKIYYDKVDDSFNNVQEGRLLFTKETDRIYQNISSELIIQDNNRRIRVKTEGSHTLVIWNPGKDLADKMPDLSDHTTMLCVESANALEDEPLIQPDKSHRLTTIISQD